MKRLVLPTLVIALGLCQCERHEPESAEAAPERESAEPKIQRSRIPEHVDPMVELRQRREAAEALPEGPARAEALSAVAWNALEVDPELSRHLLDELEPGSPGRVRLIGHLAMRLAEQSPEQAAAWAGSLEQDAERHEAVARIAVIRANSDPVGATEWLFEQVGEGRVRDRSTVQIVQRWAQSDPAAAAEWIESFPSGRLRVASLRGCLDPWIRADPGAVASWMSGLDDAGLRDDSILVVKPMLEGRPPSDRNDFMNAVRDPDLRRALR